MQNFCCCPNVSRNNFSIWFQLQDCCRPCYCFELWNIASFRTGELTDVRSVLLKISISEAYFCLLRISFQNGSWQALTRTYIMHWLVRNFCWMFYLAIYELSKILTASGTFLSIDLSFFFMALVVTPFRFFVDIIKGSIVAFVLFPLYSVLCGIHCIHCFLQQF